MTGEVGRSGYGVGMAAKAEHEKSPREPAQAIRTVPIGAAPWGDVRAAFGTRGDPSRCWCQYFKLSGSTWRGTDAATCEAALREQARHEPGPGLIAYLGGEPAGWVGIEPRPAYPRLSGTRVVVQGSAELQDDPTVWAATCFVVRVGFRRRGIGSALLRSAIEHARTAGARVVEGYPVDVAERRPSAADLYHGTLASFLAAGFEIVSRPQPGRAVVRLEF